MNRNLTIAAIAMFAVIMGMSAFAPAMADRPGNNEDNVTLCHFPPGNPANFQTIRVEPDSVADHLAHDDLLGSCQV
jgi:hypothetical protein